MTGEEIILSVGLPEWPWPRADAEVVIQRQQETLDRLYVAARAAVAAYDSENSLGWAEGVWMAIEGLRELVTPHE